METYVNGSERQENDRRRQRSPLYGRQEPTCVDFSCFVK